MLRLISLRKLVSLSLMRSLPFTVDTTVLNLDEKHEQINKEQESRTINKDFLKIIVCPLTKKPLRYDSQRQLLINDELAIDACRKNCGCKGIRTCLLCEKENDVSSVSHKTEEYQYVYNYCPSCNLCWPNDEATASLCDFPLYLGKIKLVPEFCTKEEESTLISFIDRIPWMPSQSGRRKQDFGPKINFKKKKVKIGGFKGFPKFTETMINRFQDFPELSNFDPVELCNLEYTPERGSSIDPHVDDFWLWGERLVTVNLNSSTVLTLVPCSEVACECFQEANCNYFEPTIKHSDRTNSCKHLFENGNPIMHSLKYLSKDYITDSKLSSLSCELLKDDLQNLELSDKTTKDKKYSFSPTANNETQYSQTNCSSDIVTRSSNCFEVTDSNINENEVLKNNHSNYRKNPPETATSSTINYKKIDSKINSMCNLFRTGSSDSKACIRIVMPPRSLFVLSGCARYNWFHEIKRQDVASRRLAMTFRELSGEFLDKGKESQCGKDLLSIAKNFYDL